MTGGLLYSLGYSLERSALEYVLTVCGLPLNQLSTFALGGYLNGMTKILTQLKGS